MGFFSTWARRIGRDAAKDAIESQKPTIEAAINEAVRAGVASAVDKAIKEAVADYYRKSPRFRFIKWMQLEMQQVDPTIGAKRSFEAARNTLNEHLRDEKIKFGDTRYAWDRGGAIDLIHAYEIDHWEAA